MLVVSQNKDFVFDPSQIPVVRVRNGLFAGEAQIEKMIAVYETEEEAIKNLLLIASRVGDMRL